MLVIFWSRAVHFQISEMLYCTLGIFPQAVLHKNIIFVVYWYKYVVCNSWFYEVQECELDP
jgi:hypothetical protein